MRNSLGAAPQHRDHGAAVHVVPQQCRKCFVKSISSRESIHLLLDRAIIDCVHTTPSPCALCGRVSDVVPDCNRSPAQAPCRQNVVQLVCSKMSYIKRVCSAPRVDFLPISSNQSRPVRHLLPLSLSSAITGAPLIGCSMPHLAFSTLFRAPARLPNVESHTLFDGLLRCPTRGLPDKQR